MKFPLENNFSLRFLTLVLLMMAGGFCARVPRWELKSLQFPFLDPATLRLKTVWGRKDGKSLTSRVCKKLGIFL